MVPMPPESMPPEPKAIPAYMQAVVLTGHGGPDRLEFHRDWPVPVAGPGEVLIEVAACGLNNTDVNTRTAWYSKAVRGATDGKGSKDSDAADSSWGGSCIRFPRIQGADVCGRVVALGQGADAALLGKRVLVDTWLRDWSDPMNRDRCGYYGSECDGGFAQYATAPVTNVRAIHSELSDTQLATFATACITAENMLTRARVESGDVVLIPGASGGVGSALVQLCRRRGAQAIGLCGNSKMEQVRALGAAAVLPRAPDDLRAALLEVHAEDQVDVVADVVGGAMFGSLIGALKRGGRYTCAGAIAGAVVEFDLRTFYLNDLTFTGATIPAPEIFPALVGYIERGEIQPQLASVYALEDFHAAQQAFLDKRHVGNIVVSTASLHSP